MLADHTDGSDSHRAVPAGYPHVDAVLRAVELSRRPGASFSRSLGGALAPHRDRFGAPVARHRRDHALLLEGDVTVPPYRCARSGDHRKPLSRAGGLKGKLRVVHGSGDDELHIQVSRMILLSARHVGRRPVSRSAPASHATRCTFIHSLHAIFSITCRRERGTCPRLRRGLHRPAVELARSGARGRHGFY